MEGEPGRRHERLQARPGSGGGWACAIGGGSRGADEACPVCPDWFQGGAFGSGTEGTWEPRLDLRGESEARGWEREFLPEP